MKRLILVRHGETTWNLERRLQGASDVPLTVEGRAQAIRLARHLAHEQFAAAYSSDLQRAWYTAQMIAAEQPGLTLIAEPRLREPSKGIWEGKTWREIAASYPEQVAAYQSDRENAPPGAETLSSIVARVSALLDDLRRAHSGDESVLLVAHGQTLRVLICLALEINPERFLNFQMDNTAVSELRQYPTGIVLVRLNDTGHLANDHRPDA